MKHRNVAQVRSLASETARQVQRARQESERRADAAAACSAAAREAASPGGGTTGDGADAASGQSDVSSEGPQCTWDGAENADESAERNYTELAWYAADFNEELSAFDGQLLVRPRN